MTIISTSGTAGLTQGAADSRYQKAPSQQNASPASGATVAMQDDDTDGLLVLTPAGTLASLSITLPSDANSRIGQVRRVFVNKIVTVLTVGGAASIFNAPTSMAPGDGFTLVKVAANTWAKF